MRDLGLKLKRRYLIWLLVGVGILSVIGYNLLLQRPKVTERLIEEEGKFRLGGVNIDTEKGEIHFKGRIQKTRGWVQFLVYLQGYKWLKEESAIISDTRLSDLQKAIALLDWKLWNELWHKETSNQIPESGNQRLSVSIKWNKREVFGQELVLAEDKLGIDDFIFLGSPYFDHIALDAPPGVDCRLCPIFHLEQKALRETFIRRSGHSGYKLNSERIPAQGTEVTVMIRIKK